MKTKLPRILLFILLAIGVSVVITYRDQIDVGALKQWVEESGRAAPLVFMLLYIAGTVLFFPGSVLTLAGGILFGPVLGTLYNLTAATIGAVFSFVIARYLAAGWVEKRAGKRMKRLINGVNSEGWRFVAFVRLVPIFPFNLLNYALGLTRIRLIQYAVTTFICMLPGAFAYTYLGYIGREAATGGEGLIQKSLLAMALLAAVGFLPRLIATIRRGSMVTVEELKQKLDSGAELLLLDVRNPEDYRGEQGTISGATLIPLSELEQRLAELEDYQEKPVLTICRSEDKASKAAQILSQNGFADVHVVKTGMTGWIEHQFPIEQE